MPKLDTQDQRIADIFGVKEVPDVTPETLARYLAYLKQHLTFPCQRTGIEDLGCFWVCPTFYTAFCHDCEHMSLTC